MSYLLDKKNKKRRLFYAIFGVFILLVLFYFRNGIFGGFSYASHFIFRPVLITGNYFGEKLGSVKSFFISKNSLYLENQALKWKQGEWEARNVNYNSVLTENASLKEILGRKKVDTDMILSAILAKPNQSPYDTLVIDAGGGRGISKGDAVFALGDIPIGRVSDVYPNSSKVILFSNAGERTQVVISDKNIFLEAVGRGGGNFELILPRDLSLVKGEEAVLPGIFPYVVGVVETIISDPRDPFIKALLVSPVNIQEIKFVQVETDK